MEYETEIPDDPKFALIIRRLFYIVSNAWSFGDTPLAGRSLDAIKNMVWPQLTQKAKLEFAKIKFEPVSIESLFTDEDKVNIREYRLPDDRKQQLNIEASRRNSFKERQCREKEWRLLMRVCDSLNLGFAEDITLYDEQGIQPDSIKDKG